MSKYTNKFTPQLDNTNFLSQIEGKVSWLLYILRRWLVTGQSKVNLAVNYCLISRHDGHLPGIVTNSPVTVTRVEQRSWIYKN